MAPMSLRDELRLEVRRFRDRHFLDAAMGASALVAMADDEVQLSEQIAVDYVLENVERLQVFDVHRAVERHRSYVNALRSDRDAARNEILAALARFSGDREAAKLLVRVSLAVAKADSDFSSAEKRVVSDICRALGIAETDAVSESGARGRAR